MKIKLILLSLALTCLSLCEIQAGMYLDNFSYKDQNPSFCTTCDPFFEAKAVLATAVPSASKVRAMEVDMIKQINAQRAKHKLKPLKEVSSISTLAKQHSNYMAKGKGAVNFGHGGFQARANAIFKKGYDSAGENVAYTLNISSPVSTMVKMWMNSPPHRANILGSYEATGVGLTFNKNGYCFATQLFASKS